MQRCIDAKMNRDSVQNERGPRMSTVRKQLASLRAKVRLSNGKAQFKMNQFKDKDLENRDLQR